MSTLEPRGVREKVRPANLTGMLRGIAYLWSLPRGCSYE